MTTAPTASASPKTVNAVVIRSSGLFPDWSESSKTSIKAGQNNLRFLLQCVAATHILDADKESSPSKAAQRKKQMTTTNNSNNRADTIILSEGRGDYITDIKWQRDGKAEIMGGSREDALRYTAAEAQEVIEALTAANGRGYSAEAASE
jgi:hypothetical protein